MIDLVEFRKRLMESGALHGTDEIETDTVERVQPEFAKEWPAQLHPSFLEALVDTAIRRPYRHRSDAIIELLDGFPDPGIDRLPAERAREEAAGYLGHLLARWRLPLRDVPPEACRKPVEQALTATTVEAMLEHA